MSFDTVDENRKFAEKYQFNFDLLCDTDKSIGRAYGAFDPASPDHAKRSAFVVGKDGRIAHAWEKVKAAEFPNEVAALLGAKGGEQPATR